MGLILIPTSSEKQVNKNLFFWQMQIKTTTKIQI